MLRKLVPQEKVKRKALETGPVVWYSDTALTLHSSVPNETRKLALFTAAFVSASVGLYVLLRLFNTGSTSNSRLFLDTLSLGALIGSVLLVVVTFLFSYRNPVESCVLDKDTGAATVLSRVVWRWFRPVVTRYRLQDIVAVSVKRGETDLRLDLELKSGAQVKLMEESATLSRAPEIGRQISEFLNIPMSIDIGGTAPIETYPTSDVEVEAEENADVQLDISRRA